MNTKNLVIICTTIILIGILFWPTLYRYDKTVLNGNTIPIKINRLTGNTDYYILGKWNKQEEERKPMATSQLPIEEQSKLSGQAKIIYGSLDGTIYNGTDWTIKELIVKVIAKEEDGSERWNRNFKIPVNISPLSTEKIYTTVGDNNNVKSIEWYVVSTRGYKES